MVFRVLGVNVVLLWVTSTQFEMQVKRICPLVCCLVILGSIAARSPNRVYRTDVLKQSKHINFIGLVFDDSGTLFLVY